MLHRKLIGAIGHILFLFKNRKIISNPKNILIIRSGGIGDVLMATPLISAVRDKFKQSKIDFLVGKWSAAALQNNKDIDNIIDFDDEIIFKRNIKEISKLIKKIKQRKYDLCIILDKAWEWNIIPFLAKIQSRIGFDRNGEGFSNNVNVKYNGTKYELEYNLDIAEKFGCKIKDKSMKIYPKKSNLIKNLRNVIGIAAGGAANPGQDFSEKRWPKENYLKLTNQLIKSDYNIVLFGGKKDSIISDYIKNNSIDKSKILDLTGKYSLIDTASIMKKCKYIITHDSGPMHLAAASGAKVIALFGPTPSVRFAPSDAIVIESKIKPSYDIYGRYNKKTADCMNTITVEEVFEKIKNEK